MMKPQDKAMAIHNKVIVALDLKGPRTFKEAIIAGDKSLAKKAIKQTKSKTMRANMERLARYL